MRSCKKTFCVSKVETRKRRGRGRPQAYSESWKKKVVVLRACGLDLKDILDLLERQDGTEFKAKTRRSQQIVQELLGNGNERFTPPEKDIARALAGFIRASRSRSHNSPSHDTIPLENALTSPAANIPLPISPHSHTDDIGNTTQVFDHGVDQTPQSDSNTKELVENAVDPAVNQSCQLGLGRHTVVARRNTLGQAVSHSTLNVTRQIFLKNQMRANFMKFSNTSFSSSFLSDIVSLVGRRNSCSTFDTADTLSVSAFSELDSEPRPPKDKVKKVLERRKQEDVLENTAIIKRCCSRVTFCVHKVIRELTKEYLESESKQNFTAETPRSDPIVDYLLAPHQKSESIIHVHENYELYFAARVEASGELFVSPTIRIHENDALFFAARVGAPAEVLASLMKWIPRSISINNGQTWLHCADPRLFTALGCCCDNPNDHFAKFQCISPADLLDHIDGHGRHFLFYVCASEEFDLMVLMKLVQRHQKWADRVASVSQIRDRTGLFLWDYVSMHPDFSDLSEEMQSLLRPNFDPASYPLRVLQGEDVNGNTPSFFHVHKGNFLAFSDSSLYDSRSIAQFINKYNDKGHTPIMSFLEYHFKHNTPEDTTCEVVRQLAAHGANINARSRSGATILHFAAKKGAVQLIDLLLHDLGARIDICDDNGYTATDYASKVIRASQYAKRPAELLARSIKVASRLLNVKSN